MTVGDELEGAEVFARMRAHCMAKEGAVEEYPWGHVVWKVGGKLFAIGSQGENAFTVKSTLEQQEALIQHPSICKASHVGRYGWVTITVDDEATMEIALELADESYDSVRPKRRTKAKQQEENA
jgi:predicted DNA-binding protein (MmcQ/YjbR family)